MTPTTYPTREEVFALHQAAVAAEGAFIEAYTADPNRRGMRPGDFRYRRDLHSRATRDAAVAFAAASEAWRKAYRARNGDPIYGGPV